MRTALTCLALLALSTALLRAGDRPVSPMGKEDAEEAESEEREESGAGAYFDLLNRELRLSESQRKRVQAILEESRPAREELRKKIEKLQEELRKRMRGDSEKIRALLNDDQKEKFDEINTSMRHRGRMQHGPQHWRQHGPLPGGEMPPPEMWHDKRPKPTNQQ